MRPRHVCRGMLFASPRTRALHGAASMRPRHVCRGMDGVQPDEPQLITRFNEAPACLPGNVVEELIEEWAPGTLQ